MKDYYQLFAFFNNIDGPAIDGNSAKWAPIVPRCRPPSKPRRSRRATDAQIAELKKRRSPAEAARAIDPMTARPKRPKARPPLGPTIVWIDDALPSGASPRATVRGTLSASPIIRFSAAAWRCAIADQGLNQRFFDNAGAQAQDRARRHIVCLCLYRSANPPRRRADAAMAHEWRLVASRLLG